MLHDQNQIKIQNSGYWIVIRFSIPLGLRFIYSRVEDSKKYVKFLVNISATSINGNTPHAHTIEIKNVKAS